MYGPTILDLAYHTQSRLAQMSYVFTARSLGYLVGSIGGGWMFDKYNKYLVLGCSSLGIVLGMVVFPVVRSVYALIMIGSAMAICSGILDTAGNAILFVLWPKKSQPYMQMLHFTYAFGSFLAPLLAKPFLLPESVTNSTSNATVNGYDPDGIPSVTWAYWIGTIPCIFAGIFYLACAFLKSFKDEIIKKEHQLAASYSNNKVFTAIVLALFFLFFLFYVGIEGVYGGFVFTFAVKSKPHMSRGDAALLTSTFWGTFAFARLLSVPITKYLKPQKILLIDIIGCLIASVILLSQAHTACDTHSSAKLWAGTVILGISASSIFASTLSWVEYFLAVSGRVASFLIVGACVGDMIVPVVVGNTFKSIGPCTLLYSIFALSCLCLFTFTAIHLFGRHFKSSNTSTTRIEFHKKSKLPEEPPKPKEQDEDEVLKLLNEQNNEIFNGN
ncbi:Sodium-dependent glucose transporter 1 [Exaiptasia diaphana]|nr:Sodium-dependent glucose transporter 1 [Exaiptasia diaphana]KXJ15371.1 Sodium-dependent glucose transporter 1 [Exaiptasia diaphana]